MWFHALSYGPGKGFDLSTLGLAAAFVYSLDQEMTTLPVTNITGLKDGAGSDDGIDLHAGAHSS